MSKKRIGIIGLGLMGTAIAERLLAYQFVPVVWNRSREKAEDLIARGAVWSGNPIAECDRVIISLYSGDVVSEVLTQMEPAVRPEQILIDTTTAEPEHAIHWAERLTGAGAFYLESPISGSSEQTRRGEATAIISGNETAYRQCEDLWPVLAKSCFYVGAIGNAARMKLVSNLVLGLNRAALAEGLVFAESMGLDLPATLAVLQGSAAYSRQMDSKGRKMIDRDFVPQAKLTQHLKDVRLMIEAAHARKVSLPLTETHRALLEKAEAMGWGAYDNSSIIEALRDSPS